MGKKTKKTKLPRTETPVYDQLVIESGFAPHQTPPTVDWRSMPNTTGLLEDNFS